MRHFTTAFSSVCIKTFYRKQDIGKEGTGTGTAICVWCSLGTSPNLIAWVGFVPCFVPCMPGVTCVFFALLPTYSYHRHIKVLRALHGTGPRLSYSQNSLSRCMAHAGEEGGGGALPSCLPFCCRSPPFGYFPTSPHLLTLHRISPCLYCHASSIFCKHGTHGALPTPCCPLLCCLRASAMPARAAAGGGSVSVGLPTPRILCCCQQHTAYLAHAAALYTTIRTACTGAPSPLQLPNLSLLYCASSGVTLLRSAPHTTPLPVLTRTG